MFIQRLVEHAATRSDLPPAYYRSKQIHWVVQIDEDGEAKLLDQRQPKNTAGRFFTQAPSAYRSGVRPPANLLVDTAQYILAIPKPDPKTGEVDAKAVAEAERRHGEYRDLLTRWAHSDPTNPQAQAALRFITNGGLRTLDRPEDAKYSDTVAVIVAGGPYLHTMPSAHALWAQIVRERKSSDGTRGLCLVCGEQGDLLDTIPESVKSGAIPTTGMSKDAQLVSVNTAAQGRGGTTTGLAATPVCDRCGASAMAALNALLADQEHHRRGRNSVMVWWTTQPIEASLFRALDAPEPGDVQRLLGSVHQSTQISARSAAVQANMFYAATLGLNNARVVVRDWIDFPLPEIERNIAAWFEQQAVCGGWQGTHRYHALWQLAAASGRWDGKTQRYAANSALHDLDADLLRAALRGTAMPARLLPHLLQRIRADHRIDSARIALLQLLLARSPALRKDPAVPGLDPAATDPGYLCGRMLAILEAIQRAAIPTVNTSITDKYLGTAITAPRSVLTLLRRGAQGHLKRLRRDRPGAAVALERRLQEVSGLLADIPATLNLERQARFVLGYDHQRADDLARAREAKQKNAQSPDQDAA